MEKITSNNRINKNEIRNWRRKFNGATRRMASVSKKLKAIEDELERKSISTPRRKILQAKRIEILGILDTVKVDLAISTQRLNSYLGQNNRIDSAVRSTDRKEGNVKMRVSKLAFSLQTFFKSAELPADAKDQIVSAIQKEDAKQLQEVVTFVVKDSTKFKSNIGNVDDEISGPVFIIMLRWFQKRLKVETNQTPEVAPVIA